MKTSLPRIEPTGLCKFLVGERLRVKVRLNPSYTYEVQLKGNLNGKKDTIPLTLEGKIYQTESLLKTSGFFRFVIEYRRIGHKRFQILTDDKGRPLTIRVQVDPVWLTQIIAYCIFVRFFKGKVRDEAVDRQPGRLTEETPADLIRDKQVQEEKAILPGQGGTFDDVKTHLNKLKKMHVNALYFNPIHTIGEIYRGYNLLDQLPPYLQPGSPYSVKDYKAIDPELAYDKDKKSVWLSDPQREFKELIEAAHDLGMLVIMDLVFNHTAHDFVFQRIHPEWYLYKKQINSLNDPYLYPDDVKQGLPWGDARHSMAPYDHGIFWEDCAQLNWEYRLPPAVNDPPPNFTLKAMWDFFMAIPQYWLSNFGVDGFRCDVAYRVPPAFWQKCIRQTRETAKMVKSNLTHDVIFIAESYTDDLEGLQRSGFSAVYGDYSHKLRNPLSLKGYLDYIYNLNSAYFPKGSRWFHFPDSHDFDRTPRKVVPDPVIASELALRANQSRWVLTATLPGMPLLFNGFEKIEWQPINIWSYGAINWHKEIDLQKYIAKVNDIRRHSPALEKGRYFCLETNQGLSESTQIMAYGREFGEDLKLLIVNMDVKYKAGPAEVYLPKKFDREYELIDELTQKTYRRRGQNLTVALEPGQSHIFSVKWI